jgi:WD40 repeat protein
MAAKIQVKTSKSLTGHTSSVFALSKTGDNGFFSAGGDGMVVRWPEDGSDGLLFARIPDNVYSLHFSENLNCLFAGTRNGDLFQIDNNGHVRRIQAHAQGLFTITEMDDKIITTGGDGRLILWNKSMDVEKVVHISDKSTRGLLWAEGFWWVGSSDYTIRKYSADFDLISIHEGHDGSVFSIARLPDGRIISGGRDAILRVWDTEGNLIDSIAAHLLHIHDIQLSPNAQLLATASMDKTIKIWDTHSLELLKVLDNSKMDFHSSSVNKLLWLNDEVIISAGDDRKILRIEITA